MQANKGRYICTVCGREVGKLNLKVKRVQFKEMGQGPVVGSRVVAWLCIIPQVDGSPSCLDKDDDWQRPLYAAAPGLANTTFAKEHVPTPRTLHG